MKGKATISEWKATISDWKPTISEWISKWKLGIKDRENLIVGKCNLIFDLIKLK